MKVSRKIFFVIIENLIMDYKIETKKLDLILPKICFSNDLNRLYCFNLKLLTQNFVENLFVAKIMANICQVLFLSFEILANASLVSQQILMGRIRIRIAWPFNSDYKKDSNLRPDPRNLIRIQSI